MTSTLQRGFAVIGIVVILVIAVAAIAGFILLNQNQSGQGATGVNAPGTITQKATEADFSFIEDPTLRKHFVTQANVAGYRTTGSSPASGLKQTSEAQIRGDEWSRREVEENAGVEVKNMITIGDTIYLKDYSDNTWWKQVMKFEDLPETDDEEDVYTEPKDFKEEYSNPQISYDSLAEEACGKLTCFKYQQYFSKDPEFKRAFWFDDQDYLLRKEQGGFGEFITTIEYSYDAINIQAPSPTKEVPAGKSIYDYMSEGYTQTTPGLPVYDQMPEIPSVDIEDYSFEYPEGY